jgi:Competence protein CoiA-like family
MPELPSDGDAVMLYAADQMGNPILASPGGKGTCRGCRHDLTPKCGQLVAHHWAHAAGDCDTWAEPDNAWHLAWQAWAPPERTEVTIGNHRADIITPDGRVVEIQHSPISVAEIQERERHYGRMAWIFDARQAFGDDRLMVNPRADWAGFRWKHPRKSISACARPVFLDLDGVRLLRVRKLRLEDGRCTGWGTLVDAADFRRWLGQPTLGTARAAA